MVMEGRIIDLTMPIRPGMAVYPGDPEVLFEPVTRLEADPFNLTRVSFGTHTGTHLDAPWHFMAGGETVDRIDLRKCIGLARLIDVPKGPDEEIDVEDLAPFAGVITPGARVLLRTGWSRRPEAFEGDLLKEGRQAESARAESIWTESTRMEGSRMESTRMEGLRTKSTRAESAWADDFPGLTVGAAQWLAERQIALLGLEQPSTHPTDYIKTHRALLGAGVVLVESLVNLHLIDRDEFWLAVLPLNLAGLDGSPVRAVAVLP